MRYCWFVLIFLVLGCASPSKDNKVVVLENFRGLDVLNDSVVWLSGTNGTYMYTIDGGEVWMKGKVEVAKNMDFRDVEVVNDSTAYILSAGFPGLLFKTSNRGKSWVKIMEIEDEQIFLNGMDFWNDSVGIIFGDPINGSFVVLKVEGDSVKSLPGFKALNGEAGFAASGTGIVALNDSLVWIATGGAAYSRILYSQDQGETWLPFNAVIKGGEGKGIFSMAFWNSFQGVVVGGSYLDSTNTQSNCAITSDGGRNWNEISEEPPLGYRSCVASNKDGSLIIACGRTGIDFSKDQGRSWQSFSSEAFYSVAISEKFAYFSGRHGKVDKISLGIF